MGVKEKALTAASSIASGDFLRMVTSAGASRKIDYSKLAKAIVEEYNGSTVAGSAQTLKAALDSLNSKMAYVGSGITSLDDIPICAIGNVGIFNSSIRPASGIEAYTVVAFGSSSTQRTLILCRTGNNTAYLASKSGSTWSSWKTISAS